MVSRLIAYTACSCVIVLAGCDESYSPPASANPSSAPAAAAPAANSGASTGAAADLNARQRIALTRIPFSVEAPSGWVIQPSGPNQIVLHGRAPSGEVDVLLGTGPIIKADALPLLLKESAKPSADPHVKNEVVQRNNMAIIKTVAPQVAPGAVAPADPDLVPIGWTTQFIVQDGLDYRSYDMTFVGLSQAMFDKDEAFLQQMMDSVRYEAAATRPAVP